MNWVFLSTFFAISFLEYAVDVRADGSGSRQYRRHDPGGARGPAGRVCGGHWSARPARQSCRARTGGAHACMRQCATRPARVCMSIPDPARSPHSDATPPSAVGLSRYQPLAEQASADAVVFPRARDEKVYTQPCFSILESGISDRILPLYSCCPSLWSARSHPTIHLSLCLYCIRVTSVLRVRVLSACISASFCITPLPSVSLYYHDRSMPVRAEKPTD